MGNINFGTWNGGADSRDYFQLLSDNEKMTSENPGVATLMKAHDKEADQLFATLATLRNRLLSESALNLIQEADACALQEVYGDEREDIKTFKEHNFAIIRPSNKQSSSDTDTAIAICTNKFKDIENRSFTESGGFAIAVATEIKTEKKVAFISAHIRGFDLEEPEDHMKEEAAAGDRDISNLLNYLKQCCADCETIIVGADMNAIPEIYRKRFLLFEHAGYELHRTGKPTSLMSHNGMGETPQLQQRELDYIFVKHNKKESIVDKIHCISRQLQAFFRNHDAYVTQKLDPISTPSDHVPVYLKVKLL